jgi:hypothetical protein
MRAQSPGRSGLAPEAHLRDLFRVLPHWPRDRHLELAPRYWFATLTRLDAAQLERELGPLIIPGPPPSEQPPAPLSASLRSRPQAAISRDLAKVGVRVARTRSRRSRARR